MRNGIGFGGFALLVLGLAAYDWRFGAVIAGVLMLTGSVIGMWATAPRRRK